MKGNECGKKHGDEHFQATIPSIDYDRLRTTTECGIFKLFGQHDNKSFKKYTLN